MYTCVKKFFQPPDVVAVNVKIKRIWTNDKIITFMIIFGGRKVGGYFAELCTCVCVCVLGVWVGLGFDVPNVSNLAA